METFLCKTSFQEKVSNVNISRIYLATFGIKYCKIMAFPCASHCLL